MDVLGEQNTFDAHTFKHAVYKSEHFQAKEFVDCTFVKCGFSESIFADCSFQNCVFKDCDLNLIQLPGCAFAQTRFENSRLAGVNWTETSLAKNKIALGKTVDFTGCALNHSIFMWLNLKGVRLTNCVAREVDFSEADLSDADCRGTDFENSRFWHTNLTAADFRGAVNYTIAANLNTLKKTKFSLPEAMALLYSLDIVLEEGK
jgi:uncharacterized protein YjbI with pentapeptide repeats